MARGPLETGGALVQGIVGANVSQFPTVEAGFVVSRVIMGQGGVVATAGLSNVGAFQGNFFFFG